MSATSSAPEAVDAVKDLLEEQPDTVWTADPPEINYAFDVPFNERGPGQDQPAELYLWQPVDTDLEKLTADGEFLDEGHSVQVQIFSLTEAETLQYQRDVIEVFGDYLDSQQDTTEFLTLPPTAARDHRSDKLPRRTSHYLATVEITPRKLSLAGT